MPFPYDPQADTPTAQQRLQQLLSGQVIPGQTGGTTPQTFGQPAAPGAPPGGAIQPVNQQMQGYLQNLMRMSQMKQFAGQPRPV